MTRRLRRAPSRQQGLTLVELMVSMTIALLIVLAAAAALLVSRRGYTTVDAATQLRENTRYASELIQRLVTQAGFEDCNMGCSGASAQFTGATVSPNVTGYDNGWFTQPANGADLESASIEPGGTRNHSSDVLVVRFQGASTPTNPLEADGTIVNCAGRGEPAVTNTGEPNRAVSVLHVKTSNDGEPNLMCTYVNQDGNWATVPLVSGVESMQVLYGLDTDSPPDGTPNVYRRASDITSAADWARVVTVKVGLVMRSARGAAQDQDATTFYPLGKADTDSVLTLDANALREGRLRQTVSFTAFVRNRPL